MFSSKKKKKFYICCPCIIMYMQIHEMNLVENLGKEVVLKKITVYKIENRNRECVKETTTQPKNMNSPRPTMGFNTVRKSSTRCKLQLALYMI